MTARRILLGTGAVLVAAVLGTAGLLAAMLAGVRVPLASGATWMRLERTAAVDAAGAPDDPFFMLLVGTDLRPGVPGARGDALHLVGVNPQLDQATMLDIPRDTCLAGAKINGAHARGGPRGQADAVGELVGVPVSYALSVDFAGFQSLVDGVGGVTVDVPFAMDDEYSGAVFDPGVQRLNGGQALAFSRDRHDFPSSDLQRTENQGLLIISALRQLQTEATGAAGEFRLLALLGRHAQVEGLGLRELYRLGRIARRLDPAQVRNVTIPVASGGCEGGLTLTGAAGSLFADFADDAVLQEH